MEWPKQNTRKHQERPSGESTASTALIRDVINDEAGGLDDSRKVPKPFFTKTPHIALNLVLYYPPTMSEPYLSFTFVPWVPGTKVNRQRRDASLGQIRSHASYISQRRMRTSSSCIRPVTRGQDVVPPESEIDQLAGRLPVFVNMLHDPFQQHRDPFSLYGDIRFPPYGFYVLQRGS